MYVNVYVWHQPLHLVSHPGLQSTPLDAHRGGDAYPANFAQNYDTRAESWPIMFQNVTCPDESHDPLSWPCSYTITCFQASSLSLRFQTKCYWENEHDGRAIISHVLSNSDFDTVFTSQIDGFHAKLASLIICVIDIFFYMQYIYTDIYNRFGTWIRLLNIGSNSFSQENHGMITHSLLIVCR